MKFRGDKGGAQSPKAGDGMGQGNSTLATLRGRLTEKKTLAEQLICNILLSQEKHIHTDLVVYYVSLAN